MMNNKKNKASAKETRLSIVPGVVVIAVVMTAIFGVLFLLLWRSDNVTLYFAGIFSSSSLGEEGEEPLAGEILLPQETQVELSEDRLLTPDFAAASESRSRMAALLRTVRCASRYEQTFLISYGTGEPDMISVLRDGEKYRVEASDLLIICDGDVGYVRRTVDGNIFFENRWNVEDGWFFPEEEMGVPSLDEIVMWVELSDRMPRMTFDDKNKIISLSGMVGYLVP